MTDPMRVYVPGERIAASARAFEARVLQAAAEHRHVWIIAVAYGLTDEGARNLAFADDSTDPALLDAENVLSVSPGCYICEEPLTRRRLNKPCPGDPDQ